MNRYIAVLFAASLASLLPAQVNVGSLSGVVSDAGNAVVPNASVILTNEATGVVLRQSTTSSGAYVFIPLQPGSYRLSVEASGFKKLERPNITLQVGEKLGLDVKLEVGAVTESVEVKADSPLLTTTNANVGQVIDQQKILELPLPGRDTLRLVQLAPGVGGRDSNLGDLRLGGGRTRLVEFYVDGSPTSAAGDARATALPSIDAIQEFKVETNNLAAEYGRLSGGAINVQTRAGTNEFHGSLYNFTRDAIFNANTWDGNRRNSPRGEFSLNQFGGTIGGPIRIPKLYDGRNRSFFFFNYDAERRNDLGSLRFATMPTALERQGDFSQTLNSQGQRVTIYDPLTYDAATNTRRAFPNNRIPEGRFDPAAKYMLQLWPSPNRDGDPLTGLNNFSGINSSESARDNFTLRLDQNIGSAMRFYARLTSNYSTSNPNYWAGPATSGVRPSWLRETGSTVNWNWTPQPTLILAAQFGAAPRDFTYYPTFEGFDPTQVPFAANARRELDPRFIPNMNFERVAGLGVNFGTTWLRERYFFGSVSATKIWSKHTVKAGWEVRPVFLNNIEPGTPSGGAGFSGAWTGLNQQAAFAQQGSGLASFLLGLPDNFSFDSSQLGWAVSFRNHAFYVQDDYKVSQKLTLNLGLRWEYEAPMTERFNRLAIVDHNADNGYRINSNYNFARDVIGANQLPAGSPVPNLSGPFLGGVGLTNTPQFPGRGNTRQVFSNFGPRLGLAYKLSNTLVLRTGGGILYSGYTGNASGSDSLSIQRFFRTRGDALFTADNGRTAIASLSNPFPNNAGLQFATNDPTEITRRYIGSGLFAYQYDHRPSYELSYNFGLQKEFKRWVFEGTFIGNRGVNLYVGGNPWVNPLDFSYLSLGANMDRAVANPFFNAGLPENGFQITRATIPYKNLLRPQPHLVGDNRILQRATGLSQYLAGYFRAERRYSNGLSVLLSYTISKLIENTSAKTGSVYPLPQDGKDFSDLRSVSVQDIPQKLVVTYLYDLPFGRGRRFFSAPQGGAQKFANAIIGGWAVSGFTTIQSGYPLQIQQNDNYTGGQGWGRLRPTLLGDYRSGASNVADSIGFPNEAKGRYLNRNAFSITNRYGIGTVPVALPNYRQPNFYGTDLALMKDFRFGEKRYLQIRAEAQNAFNTPVFQLGNNEMNIQNANFGLFNATANQPRNMQFGARFVF
jgi:hypothetical protein